jgi:hypothetical protein
MSRGATSSARRSVARAANAGAGLGLAGLAVLALALGGCGYSFRGNLPPHIRTVAVPVFVNRTQEPALENTITAAVVNAFVSSGRLRVVPLAQADSVLQGEITGYSLVPLAFDRNINIQEYRLVVTLNLLFRDARQGGVLWRQDGLQERGDFRLAGQPGTVGITIGREEGAVREAAAQIGRRIVTLATDRF